MTDKLEIVQAVLEAMEEVGGRRTLSCEAAFRLAEEMNLDLLDIGQVCNEEKIRIVRCQLGCFK